jgi:DDE superfamily endonuclease
MIIFGVINAPGSIHDSSLASFFGMYEKLQAVYDKTGLKVIMDSAFCASEYEFITKSSQNFEAIHFNSMEMMAINSAATSMRQAAEWGMRALEGSFPRLQDTFPYEDGPGERLETLQMIMLLYNFRCKNVGLNQLRNTFVVEWSKDAQYLMS